MIVEDCFSFIRNMFKQKQPVSCNPVAQKAIQNVEQKAKEKYEKDIMIMKKQIENDRIAAMKRHAMKWKKDGYEI